MNFEEQYLWAKISAFKFDKEDTTFTFSKRIARENAWTDGYTLRVIEEYRRFIFLCCISEKGITPSDPVDQVWHLHLTYTKSYWEDFCINTLSKKFIIIQLREGKKKLPDLMAIIPILRNSI